MLGKILIAKCFAGYSGQGRLEEIKPGLFLGSASLLQNEGLMTDLGITNVFAFTKVGMHRDAQQHLRFIDIPGMQ